MELILLTIVAGIIISLIIKGEEENHYLYALYLTICTMIILCYTAFEEFAEIYEQIGSVLIIAAISYVINLLSYKWSANTTSSKLTYFIKFVIINVALDFGIQFIFSLIFNN